MSRGTPGDARITRLLVNEPWPPHDAGDLEATWLPVLSGWLHSLVCEPFDGKP
jgi:hypothetical protein